MEYTPKVENKKKSKIEKIIPITILVFAVLTRFAFFGYPSQVVFDEVYFGKYSSDYITHTSFYDIHPPLGKLLIAGVAKLFWQKGNCSFEKIGQSCPKNAFLSFRLLPILTSIVFVFLIYKFVLILTNSKRTANITSFLILFENAFLVQGKYIFLDIFLLFFGILGLYLFFLYKKQNKLFYLIFSGIFLGASFSIKWTGLSYLGIVFLILIWQIFKKEINLKKFFLEGFSLFIFSLLIYTLSFYIHFSLIPNKGMQAEYLGKNFGSLNFFQKFIKINVDSFRYQATLKAKHPFQSKPYQWLVMKKPVYYWVSKDNKARIYFIGNPVIWYSSLLSFFILLFIAPIKKIRESLKINDFLIFIIISGFLINFLPFFPIERCLFMYAFLSAYLFLIINLSIILNLVFKTNKKFFIFLIILIISGFLLISPLTYGLKTNLTLYNPFL